MKKLAEKLKKNRALIANLCFVIFFAVVFVLILIFQYDIQFLSNDFQTLSKEALQVYYLDVGQASATLVILPTGRTLLIDTGSMESEHDFLRSLNKIMKQNRRSKIDMLLLTHSDEDHIGGALALFEKYQVDTVYRPKVISSSPFDEGLTDFKEIPSTIFGWVMTTAFKEPDCKVEFIEDEIFVDGDCVIEVFSCKNDVYSDTNSYSPFVTITFEGKVFMFCGDATKAREEEFVSAMENECRTLEVDFLLVAHHGAKSSSTERFLSFTKPKRAIVSAGDDLHPTQPVLDRLIACGTREIFCTKTDGMIGIAVRTSGAYTLKTMSDFVDLPFFVCIIFVVGEVWLFYFQTRRQQRKFS